MAKSLFEPKRVPKYTENIIKPTTGLQAAPVPVRQQSAARPVPKTQAIPPAAQQVSAPAPAPVAPPAPAPTPAPPAPVGETRAFSFDGSTELTGSLTNVLTTAPFNRQLTVGFTATPYWSRETTGSFAVLSIGKPDSDDSRLDIYITRTSGSRGRSGYRNWIDTRFKSGSASITATRQLQYTNFISGSAENVHLQITMTSMGYMRDVKENSKVNKLNNVNSFIDVPACQQAAARVIALEDYTFSIGGFNSGSDHYFSGSLSNLYTVLDKRYLMSSPVIESHYEDPLVKLAYKFEGNLEAEKGDIELVVVGTETYVSSSI